MKTKGILLSLMASTLVNLPQNFAKKYNSSTSLAQSKNNIIDLYPVKFSKKVDKNSFEYNGNYLIPLTKKPILSMTNFLFQTVDKGEIGIRLKFDEQSNKVLNELSHKYINNKLAVIHNGKIIMAPTVKSIITQQEIKHQFKNKDLFLNILDELKSV